MINNKGNTLSSIVIFTSALLILTGMLGINGPPVFKIIGFAGGCFLAVWPLLIKESRNTWIDIMWVSAVMGLNGLFFINGPFDIKIVMLLVAFSQAALISWHIFQRFFSKSGRIRRLAEKQVKTELEKIFSPFQLSTIYFLINLCGSIIVLCVNILAWGLLIFRPGNNPEEVMSVLIYPMVILGVFIFFGPFAFIGLSSLREFLKRPGVTLKELKEAGDLFLLIVVPVSMVVAITVRNLISWAAIGIWAATLTAFYRFWFGQMETVLKKAQNSDYHDGIIEIFSKNPDVVQKTFSAVELKVNITFDESGVALISPVVNKVIPWDRIKHFIFESSIRLNLVDTQNNYFEGRLLSSKKQRITSESKELAEKLWLEYIGPQERMITCFEYPQEQRKNKSKKAVQQGWAWVFIGFIFLLLAVFELAVIGYKSAWLAEGIIGIGIVLFGLYEAKAGKKEWFNRISITTSGLVVDYDNGTRNVYDLERVVKFNLSTLYSRTFIKFDDGTKLNNLDFVSYWPILKEWLQVHFLNSRKSA
jgi:hypothetical protein